MRCRRTEHDFGRHRLKPPEFSFMWVGRRKAVPLERRGMSRGAGRGTLRVPLPDFSLPEEREWFWRPAYGDWNQFILLGPESFEWFYKPVGFRPVLTGGETLAYPLPVSFQFSEAPGTGRTGTPFPIPRSLPKARQPFCSEASPFSSKGSLPEGTVRQSLTEGASLRLAALRQNNPAPRPSPDGPEPDRFHK